MRRGSQSPTCVGEVQTNMFVNLRQCQIEKLASYDCQICSGHAPVCFPGQFICPHRHSERAKPMPLSNCVAKQTTSAELDPPNLKYILFVLGRAAAPSPPQTPVQAGLAKTHVQVVIVRSWGGGAKDFPIMRRCSLLCKYYAKRQTQVQSL